MKQKPLEIRDGEGDLDSYCAAVKAVEPAVFQRVESLSGHSPILVFLFLSQEEM